MREADIVVKIRLLVARERPREQRPPRPRWRPDRVGERAAQHAARARGSGSAASTGAVQPLGLGELPGLVVAHRGDEGVGGGHRAAPQARIAGRNQSVSISISSSAELKRLAVRVDRAARSSRRRRARPRRRIAARRDAAARNALTLALDDAGEMLLHGLRRHALAQQREVLRPVGDQRQDGGVTLVAARACARS